MPGNRKMIFSVMMGGGDRDKYIDAFDALSPAWLSGDLATAANLSVSDGKLIITPTGTEKLTDPGLESWFSATNLGSYNEDIAGTSNINKETDGAHVHGGSFSCRMDIDAAGSTAQFRQACSYAIGWYKALAYIEGSAGTGEKGIIGPESNSTPTNITNPFTLTNSFALYKRSFRTTAASGPICYFKTSNANGLSVYFDDVSYQAFVDATLFSVKRVHNPKGLKIAIKMTLGTYQLGGVAFFLNSTNYIVAYLDGAGYLVLVKVIAGTFTEVRREIIIYSAGAVIAMEADSTFTKFSISYNGQNPMINVSIADFSGAPGAWYAGTFSTDESTSFDDFETSRTPNRAIGLIYGIAGQSNASGRATNLQVTTNMKANLFGNDYLLRGLIDKTDSDLNYVDSVSRDADAAGSVWPLLATSMIGTPSDACTFVSCACKTTTILQWQPGADHQDRTTLYGSMVYRILQVQALGGTAKCVLLHLGEQDIKIATSRADFLSRLTSFGDAVFADLGVKVMACKIENLTTWGVGYNNTNVNLAIGDAWALAGNIIQGPDFSDLTPSSDGVHFATDLEMSTLASRWWVALQTAFSW